MLLKLQLPRESINKAFLKVKPNRKQIEVFKSNIISLLDNVNNREGEEYNKNLVSEFLKNTWYAPAHFINTKGRADLVIHNGKDAASTVGVLFEVKKPEHKAEMPSKSNLNSKAFQELILYYLRERIKYGNANIKHLIITDIFEWFIFSSADFEHLFANNKKLVQDFNEFEEKRGLDTVTDFFYKSIAEPLIKTLDSPISFTYFDIREFEKIIRNPYKEDDNRLIVLYKIFSPEHLLKLPFTNDSNTLDKTFYTELLNIIGLEETKYGSKKVIERKKEERRNQGSLIENTLNILKSEDCLSQLKRKSNFGNTTDEQYYNIALELVITWINRILFLKLLEGQLVRYNGGDRNFSFLNTSKIDDFDELNKLFFRVLAVKEEDRSEDIRKKYSGIPFLNSSLFEPTGIERNTLRINSLDDSISIPILSGTVLKDRTGKKLTGSLKPLDYLFSFLDAYDFSSEGSEEIQEENKTLINASVLGLIFEKINGYKDGSFFTPGFITMYMCHETITRAVVQKFNEVKGWGCESVTDVYNHNPEKAEANSIINSLKICDPAVGSGHFLVSALNEIIAIKSELGILADKGGKLLRDYSIEVINDELVITDSEGKFFEYNPKNKESQRVQETLFREKQAIIENCLFGVDINPNSVKICRLRLWIELLKNAYYKEWKKSPQLPVPCSPQLETLPNIDINIKCGNSLISRYPLDADIRTALRSSKWTIDNYREAVMTYRNAKRKDEKRSMEELIAKIKTDFESEVSHNDKRYLKLNKLKGDLMGLSGQTTIFELSRKEKEEWNKKVNKLTVEIQDLESQISEIRNNKIYENAFEWRFEFPEVLNNEGDFVGFDVVIGNPPYGVPFSDGEKNFIRSNFISYSYKFDSYVYFIELGLKILRLNGYMEFITPILWLALENCFEIRSIVLNNYDLKRILVHGENVFSEAIVNTCSFQIRKSMSPSDDLLIIKDGSTMNVLKTAWIEKPSYVIHTNVEIGHRVIFKKILDKSTPLSNFGSVIQGITAYDRYRGQSQEIIRSRAFHYSFKKDETCGKWLEGKNLNRYSIVWEGTWLSYGEWLAAPREKRFFEGDRILFREIPGPNKRIQACLTSEQYYYGHSISPFVPSEKIKTNIRYILAIVNSKLLSWYSKYQLPNFSKDIFPKLNPNDIQALPIPIIFNKEDEINLLIDKILSLKSEDANIITSQYDAEIDKIVYEIFDLTQEEIQIVEED